MTTETSKKVVGKLKTRKIETPLDIEKKIRKRSSYDEWKRWYNEIQKMKKNGPITDRELLWLIHNAIDSRGGYYYATTAGYAAESLEQFIKDRGL